MEEKKIENSKYKIIADYIKDLSFEIPSPDCFVDAAQNLDKYETKVDISNKPLKNGMLELNCKLIFEAPKEIQNKIHAEACLAVVFKITNTELKEDNRIKLETKLYIHFLSRCFICFSFPKSATGELLYPILKDS